MRYAGEFGEVWNLEIGIEWYLTRIHGPTTCVAASLSSFVCNGWYYEYIPSVWS